MLQGRGIVDSISDESHALALFLQLIDQNCLLLGAYLGAVEGIQTAALKPVVARIAASEAQHVAYLSTIKGLSSFQAFPNPMTIQQVSNALDVYTA